MTSTAKQSEPLNKKTFDQEIPIYETNSYVVVRDTDPVVHDGEPLNWVVVNKEHNTVEGSFTPLPYAINIANQLDEMLVELRKMAIKGV